MERLRGNWDDMVVVCGGTAWDGLSSSERHLASELTAYAPVLYVDPAISHLTARRKPHVRDSLREPRLRLVSDRLARLTPVALPGLTRRGMHVVTERIVRRSIRGAVDVLGGDVRALLAATHAVYFGAAREQISVLYATDDFVAGASLMGIDAARLQRDEQRVARQIDLVLAASPALVDKWRALGPRTILLPNGCEAERHAGRIDGPPPPDVRLPAPIAGLVGHVSARIDLDLLEAVADRGVSLLIVGPRDEAFEPDRLDRLFARRNVCWVGRKTPAELPGYLACMTVGLTPYEESDFNAASFPLKTLEYLAAGRDVVATDLPAVRWLDTDLITVASSPREFADAVERAVAEPATEALGARRKAFAAGHSWSVRAREVAGILGLVRQGSEPELAASGDSRGIVG